jgi:hypothetical protein
LDVRIKSYECLKFLGEVWAGRACVGANEEELTICKKNGGKKEEEGGKVGAKGGGGGKIMGDPCRHGRRPNLDLQSEAAGRSPPGDY